MQVSIWLYLIQQTSLTCCLLLCNGLCAGLRSVSWLRMLLTSLGTAIMTAVAADASGVIRAGTLLLCSLCAPVLSWSGVPKRLRTRLIAGGAFLSLGLTGLMRLAAPLAWPGILIVLAACLLLRLTPAILPKPEETPRLATVDVRHGAHHLTLTALIDSGNLLRDGVTGLPVIVISQRAAQRLVQLPQKSKVVYPFRLLAVRTISGTAMMTVFHPDSVCLLLPQGWTKVETLLGVSPEGYDGFQALVPACLMTSDLAMTI